MTIAEINNKLINTLNNIITNYRQAYVTDVFQYFDLAINKLEQELKSLPSDDQAKFISIINATTSALNKAYKQTDLTIELTNDLPFKLHSELSNCLSESLKELTQALINLGKNDKGTIVSKRLTILINELTTNLNSVINNNYKPEFEAGVDSTTSSLGSFSGTIIDITSLTQLNNINETQLVTVLQKLTPLFDAAYDATIAAIKEKEHLSSYANAWFRWYFEIGRPTSYSESAQNTQQTIVQLNQFVKSMSSQLKKSSYSFLSEVKDQTKLIELGKDESKLQTALEVLRQEKQSLLAKNEEYNQEIGGLKAQETYENQMNQINGKLGVIKQRLPELPQASEISLQENNKKSQEQKNTLEKEIKEVKKERKELAELLKKFQEKKAPNEISLQANKESKQEQENKVSEKVEVLTSELKELQKQMSEQNEKNTKKLDALSEKFSQEIQASTQTTTDKISLAATALTNTVTKGLTDLFSQITTHIQPFQALLVLPEIIQNLYQLMKANPSPRQLPLTTPLSGTNSAKQRNQEYINNFLPLAFGGYFDLVKLLCDFYNTHSSNKSNNGSEKASKFDPSMNGPNNAICVVWVKKQLKKFLEAYVQGKNSKELHDILYAEKRPETTAEFNAVEQYLTNNQDAILKTNRKILTLNDYQSIGKALSTQGRLLPANNDFFQDLYKLCETKATPVKPGVQNRP